MPILRTTFSGDENLGLYGFATDKYCLLGVQNKKVENALGVPVKHTSILNTDFLGLFVAGNSHGIVISGVVKDHDMHRLEKMFKEILVLKSNYSALGNLIMMNDSGIVLSPLLRKHKREIERFFGVPCVISTIAKQNIVGNLGLATNKGCLLHPKVRKVEMQLIEETLKVKSDIGTVNFGSPYPGAGVLANSNGFVASERTSGPELGRITESLGLL